MEISGIGLDSLLSAYRTGSTQSTGNLDEAAERVIKNKDKDGDGMLSAVEVSISPEAFQLADANADGQLDAGEIKGVMEMLSAGSKASHAGGPPMGPHGSKDDDDDEDTETGSSLTALFNQADTNGDGVLSLEELQAALAQSGKETGTGLDQTA